MSPLNLKLARDLWRIKGQAAAIGAVVAVGVMLQVMMTGLVASLDETRRAYYERYRLAEVFVPVARAPVRLTEELMRIPGVAAVEDRVVGSALVDLEALDLPIQAQVVSLPRRGEAKLNDIYLTSGRRPEVGKSAEVILLESFADAHGLMPGASISATMNGFRRSFLVVGLAQSPEFLYTTPPGEFAPNDARFAVIWMNRDALGAAFDLDGAFNEALMSLTRDTDPLAVQDAADRLLDPYGARGAFGLEDLFSNFFVTEEINGLRQSASSMPPIFLAVAAFLLYIVISRMVQAEREEIGLMKAFGYSNTEVGWHYFKMVLAIAIGGAVAGGLLGIAMGRWMVEIYLEFFKFPFLVFRLDPASFVSGFLISVLSASAGGLFVMRGVMRLSPAEAMRPAAPPDYSRTGRMRGLADRLIDQPTRMVLRRFTRQPGRMAGAVAGISAGVALSAAMTSILASFESMLDLTFGVIDRSHVSVTFTHPLAARTVYDLESIPGVLVVEPVRNVAAVMSNGVEEYRGAITGLTDGSRLFRAIDADMDSIPMRRDGVILSSGLAEQLKMGAGDVLTVDVREGRQPVVDIPVISVSQSLFGSPVYMELGALNRILGDPLWISGAYLRVDQASTGEVYRTIKDMPLVAGVAVAEESRVAMQRTLDEGAGSSRYIMFIVAAVITFGVVYNAARVAQAERSRDLAGLRVLGFTRAEVAYILLGELALATLLALPVGAVLGFYLNQIMAAAYSTDLYQIQAKFDAASYGSAILIVVFSALVSGWLVKRDIDRTDLVAALKVRE